MSRTKRVAPTNQAVERREGSGYDDVVGLMMVFGAGSDDLDASSEAQLFDSLGQKGAPSKQGLKQRELKVRSQQGKRYARQARATAHVDDRLGRCDQPAQGGAIEDVPIPQAVSFPWTEQAPFDSRRPQNIDISI
jgi:hypothetical protein